MSGRVDALNENERSRWMNGGLIVFHGSKRAGLLNECHL